MVSNKLTQLWLQRQLSTRMLSQVETLERVESLSRCNWNRAVWGRRLCGPKTSCQNSHTQIDTIQRNVLIVDMIFELLHYCVGHGHVFEHAF
jgi:hypothetical protein